LLPLNGRIEHEAGRKDKPGCVSCVQNYNTIFWVAPAFMLVAIGCMWFVTRGEAKT
jgi:hypothetical protein